MLLSSYFFFNATPTTEIYTLSLHDALPIFDVQSFDRCVDPLLADADAGFLIGLLFVHQLTERRSEEHTSELQSLTNLVCRLLLEKKNKKKNKQKDKLHTLQ